MDNILTLAKVEILIEFCLQNVEDAKKIGEHALTCLKEGTKIVVGVSELNIPALKEDISISNKGDLDFISKGVRDFFCVYSVYSKEGDMVKAISVIWKLKYRSNNKSRIDNDYEYLLIILNRVYNEKITSFIKNEKQSLHITLHSFSNIIEILSFDVKEIIELIEQLNEYSNTNIYEGINRLVPLRPEMCFTLYDKIESSSKNLAYLEPLASGLQKQYGIEKFHMSAFELLKVEDTVNSQIGISILGRLEYGSHSLLLKETTDKLVTFLVPEKKELHIQVISVLLVLLEYTKDHLSLILNLSEDPSNEYRHAISNYIWRNNKKDVSVDTSWFSKASFAISKNPTDNKGITQCVDWYLRDLYHDKANREYAFQLLESWIIHGQNVKSFENAIEQFMSDDFDFFCQGITRWFLSREIKFLTALMLITTNKSGKDFKLDVQLLNSCTDDEVFRIIAGVAGYVFSSQALATLILSILDSKHSKNWGSQITKLFTTYICYTYPSTLEDVIKVAIPISNGEKRKILKAIVKEVDEYFESIRELPILKELAGSERRQEVYFKGFQKKQNTMYEEVDKKSVFNQMGVHNVLLRSGPIWFSKIDGEYGNESRMNQFSYSFEMPRAEYIDPATFEIYRMEMRRKAIEI